MEEREEKLLNQRAGLWGVVWVETEGGDGGRDKRSSPDPAPFPGQVGWRGRG